VPQVSEQRRKQLLRQAQPSRTTRGSRFGGETLTLVPADVLIRPLRDQMIVEPLETIYSRHIIVDHHTKPLRGIVKAIGPGHFPKKYDHALKHKRTKMWDSKHFQPTELKVGDVVELGGAEIGGYAFETFYWGDVMHLHCREADVAIVREMSEHQAREEARNVAAA
jgi:hypothetical protein